MKESLVLQPNATAQWHALIEDARQHCSISLSEDLESYLVFLLMRFANNPTIVDSIIAPDFLQNVKKLKKENQEILKDVGDKCLLFAGFFPGQAKRRLVKISYYVKLGQSAYSFLSESQQNQSAHLYAQLGLQFVRLMEVLQSIRELDLNHATLELLEAEALWTDTGNRHALRVLRRVTKGFLIPQETNSSEIRH
jgi:hypothetical protein